MARLADPLAQYFVHRVLVRRPGGTGAFGAIVGQPVAERAFVSDSRKLVRDADGNEVVSSATVTFPASVALIPLGAEITLPGTFGGRTARAIAVSVADGGTLPTPNHQAVSLE